MRMMLYQPRAWLIWRSSFALGSKCSYLCFSSTHRLATKRAALGFDYLAHQCSPALKSTGNLMRFSRLGCSCYRKALAGLFAPKIELVDLQYGNPSQQSGV